MNKANNHYLEVKSISKYFGRRKVLQGIDFYLKKGEFVTIFGPNGVGKTTLIRVLSTILNPTDGDFLLEGVSAKRDPVFIRKNIGVISHNPYVYPDLTANENLRFFSKLFGVDDIDKRIDKLLKLVNLSDRRYDLAGTFSRGMLQRLAIARALLHEPPILFLDEPHSGLDPRASEVLDQIIADYRKTDTTFIMTTHSLRKGLELSDRALILTQKGIAYNERVDNLEEEAFKKIYMEKCEA